MEQVTKLNVKIGDKHVVALGYPVSEGYWRIRTACKGVHRIPESQIFAKFEQSKTQIDISHWDSL